MVETKPFESRRYVVDRVISSSGHKSFRIVFSKTDSWRAVIEEITSLGCMVEVRWEKSQLIAVDASSFEAKGRLEEYLTNLESKDEITWECAN